MKAIAVLVLATVACNSSAPEVDPDAGDTTGDAASSVGSCGGTTANVAWVYYNGQFNWPFDYSWGGLVLDYMDTTGAPLSGAYDIKATGPAYAGWQPASMNWSFDITGCNYLTFALRRNPRGSGVVLGLPLRW